MEMMYRMIHEWSRKTGMVLLFSMMSVTGAVAQDLLVTNSGESLTVYNLEIGPTAVFYQLSADANADIKRIAKTDVLIIRKADGTKIDPNAAVDPAEETKKKASSSRALRELPKHEVVTAVPSTPIETDNKDVRKFSVNTAEGLTLNFQVLSEEKHTLAVIPGEYNDYEKTYVIPDYVTIDGQQYAVTEIADRAFFWCKLQYVIFPSTLKKIGERAFSTSNIKAIILPEGLEEIGESAFGAVRWRPKKGSKNVDEIYIPESVTRIGSNCFYNCGGQSSFRLFCQAYFSCMPSMIKEGNCKNFGIDEEAVRAYNEALKDKQKY